MRENKHIQDINHRLDRTLNHFSHMVFEANQDQNETYTFKEIFLQPDKNKFIMYMFLYN